MNYAEYLTRCSKICKVLRSSQCKLWERRRFLILKSLSKRLLKDCPQSESPLLLEESPHHSAHSKREQCFL